MYSFLNIIHNVIFRCFKIYLIFLIFNTLFCSFIGATAPLLVALIFKHSRLDTYLKNSVYTKLLTGTKNILTFHY